jgi:hypothetical protein
MVSILNKELIGSPHKTLIKGNLFDFIKKRENMNLCGSEKSVLKPFLKWLISNLFIMDKTKEQLEKLREVAEASLTKTDELQKVLAQIEALMSREESQTLSKKK